MSFFECSKPHQRNRTHFFPTFPHLVGHQCAQTRVEEGSIKQPSGAIEPSSRFKRRFLATKNDPWKCAVLWISLRCLEKVIKWWFHWWFTMVENKTSPETQPRRCPLRASSYFTKRKLSHLLPRRLKTPSMSGSVTGQQKTNPKWSFTLTGMTAKTREVYLDDPHNALKVASHWPI